MTLSITIKDLLDFIVLVLLYLFVFYRRWQAKGKDILLINTLMYIYISAVIYFTLMPVITSLPFILSHPYTPMNLEPFIDVSFGRGDFILQIALNIIMTIPFGFLFPLLRRPYYGFLKTILATLLLSLAIEILQPFISSYRSSDITDVITNVVGGMIGYALFLIFRPLTNKILTNLQEAPKQ